MVKPVDTNDIPQADSLEKVLLTVEAVSRGNTSFQDIATYLDVVNRQGRYYRRAAEILKLISRGTEKNTSVLTSLGSKFIQSNQMTKNQIIMNQVLGVSIIQNVVNVLSNSGGTATRDALRKAIMKFAPQTTKGMVYRRLTTILSWLDELEIVERYDARISLSNVPSLEKLEISDLKAPLLPKPNNLKIFEETSRRVELASSFIKFEVDKARFDRANVVHEHLRSLIAKKIRHHGALPTFNKYLDLAVRMNDNDFIIEVKTSTNVRSQVRKAVSQLYEYRYLQCLPDAKLVLLLEKPLSGKNEWMLDYLIKDRGIWVVWDNAGDELFTTEEAFENLPFMA